MENEDKETKDMLYKIVKELENTGGIEGIAIIKRDGVLMVSKPEMREMKESIAMIATMLGAAETVTSELGIGASHSVMVETAGGKLVAMGAGPKVILAAVASPEIGIGLIILEMEKTAKKIKEVLEVK